MGASSASASPSPSYVNCEHVAERVNRGGGSHSKLISVSDVRKRRHTSVFWAHASRPAPLDRRRSYPFCGAPRPPLISLPDFIYPNAPPLFHFLMAVTAVYALSWRSGFPLDKKRGTRDGGALKFLTYPSIGRLRAVQRYDSVIVYNGILVTLLLKILFIIIIIIIIIIGAPIGAIYNSQNSNSWNLHVN